MTIDEAIKMLDRISAQDEESGRPECVEAEKLGIEALKRVKRLRPNECYANSTRLPGEKSNDHR